MLRNRAIHVTLAVGVLLLLGMSCGDNEKPQERDTPQPLIPDLSVEQGCTTAPPPTGEVRVKRLECDTEKVSGLLAVGRSGDFVMENSLARFVMRGPGEGYHFYGTTGGALIDAALHGRDDQLIEFQPLLDGGGGSFNELVITSSGQQNGSEPGVAELVFRGPAAVIPLLFDLAPFPSPDFIIEQRFRLRPDVTALEVTTRVYQNPDGISEVAALRDVAFFGGELQLFLPGSGFMEGLTASGRFVSSSGGQNSYGIVYENTPAAGILVFELEGIFFMQAVDIAVEKPPVRRFFVVGDGSVSSLTDVIYSLEGPVSTVSGTSTPGFTIAIQSEDGLEVTRVRTDASGVFSADLPHGDYQLQCVEAGTVPGPVQNITLGEDDVTELVVARGAGGLLQVTVTDDAGIGMPARVMLTLDGDNQTIHMGPEPITIPVVPGTYSVSISRGMEFGEFQQIDLVVVDGDDINLNVSLEREVDTDGWIAVDTHLHSEMSTDSKIPLRERLLSVTGEGVEVAISTDHDFITDYNPYIETLGLSEFVASQLGAESSSSVVGHINGWPLELDPDVGALGAVPWFGKSPDQIVDLIRDGRTDRIVQLNHPRRTTSSTFNAIELDPATLTSLADPAAFGFVDADFNRFNFDAIEVANAKSKQTFEEVFVDWLAFVVHGQRKTATGASDSHRATAYSGRARTYVWVGLGLDEPSTVDMTALNLAIADGKAIVSQGAFVTISVEDPVSSQSYGIGEIAPLQGQTQVELRVRVQAASWLPLTTLRIYEKDQVVFEQNLDPLETQPLRFDQVITLPLSTATDTFFLARVEAGASGGAVLPSPGPSFTNPVLVDRDGDGEYAP